MPCRILLMSSFDLETSRLLNGCSSTELHEPVDSHLPQQLTVGKAPDRPSAVGGGFRTLDLRMPPVTASPCYETYALTTAPHPLMMRLTDQCPPRCNAGRALAPLPRVPAAHCQLTPTRQPPAGPPAHPAWPRPQPSPAPLSSPARHSTRSQHATSQPPPATPLHAQHCNTAAGSA